MILPDAAVPPRSVTRAGDIPIAWDRMSDVPTLAGRLRAGVYDGAVYDTPMFMTEGNNRRALARLSGFADRRRAVDQHGFIDVPWPGGEDKVKPGVALPAICRAVLRRITSVHRSCRKPRTARAQLHAGKLFLWIDSWDSHELDPHSTMSISMIPIIKETNRFFRAMALSMRS